MSDNMKIEITKDGPYIVYGEVPLFDESIRVDFMGKATNWDRGEKLFPDEIYTLCRCGKSKSKPYCDGAHSSGFDGTETAHKGTFEEHSHVVGKGVDGIELLQEPILCTGAGFCHAKTGVGNLIKKEKTLKDAEQQCRDCAGGSLTLRKDGVLLEDELPEEITVTTTRSGIGPLRVTGGIVIVSDDGTPYEIRNRVALCRCGASRNKPFCDGAHLKL
jgi:CDGSH-type Zn-finger protein